MPTYNVAFLVEHLWVSAPVACLSTCAIVVLLAGAFWPAWNRTVVPVLSILSVLITIGITLYAQRVVSGPVGMQILDDFSVVFNIILLVTTVFAILVASPYITREGLVRGEYYALMLFATAGAMLMTASENLIVMYLGLELLSIPLYVLAGFARQESSSEEAAMKYFLLGSYASAFFVFGMALVFSVAGDTSFSSILAGLRTGIQGEGIMLALGMSFVLIALAFKVAIVPFHMWAPDVYQGAPTSVTAFMTVVAKAAGFGAIIRLGVTNFEGSWQDLLWVLAALSMIWGNLLAITQDNIKRLLAYSSIAHAGYLLMGLLGGTPEGVNAALLYVAVYSAMTYGSFTVAILLAGKGDQYENISHYRGVARKSPLLGVTMAIFMLSLAGIPPFAGFFSKLFIFMSAVQGGYVGLTVIAVLTSVVSVFYYLRVLVIMWMEEPATEPIHTASQRPTGAHQFVLVSMSAVVIFLGLFSGPVLKATRPGADAAVPILIQKEFPVETPAQPTPVSRSATEVLQ